MKKLQFILSLVFLGCVSASAFATDTKIYPGASCQRHSGSTNYNHSSGIFRNNSSTQTLTVVCPVIKDESTKSIQDGWIKVLDLNKDANFTCSAKSRYRKNDGGWTNYWSGNKYSSGHGTHTQTLGFGGFSQVSGGSHYYIVCTIPKKDPANGASYLISYRVDENQ